MLAPAPLLNVAAVGHSYGEGTARRPVLFDVNLVVRPGEIVVLTGPSGSGKTTLLTLIGALRSLQSGGIRLWDTELRGLKPKAQVAVRRRLGFIFQEHNLFESLTARQNVAMAASLATHPLGDAGDAMLAAVGLADLGHRLPRELSSGQRQRVAIARALSIRPGLVLADEPTAALDQATGRDVIALLRKLADTEGLAVVLVTHDSRLFSFADRLVQLVDGRLVADLPVKTLVALCTHLHTSGALAALSPGAMSQVARALAVGEFSAGAEIAGAGVLLDGELARPGGAALRAGAVFGFEQLLRESGAATATAAGAPTLRVATATARVATISRAEFTAARGRARSAEEQTLAQLFHTLL
ncbi:MAG: hypothetical protein RLZZ15_1891 [Verrucomicrobiota bacterium]|jgi:putative ABC transport system ATP-binding protein